MKLVESESERRPAEVELEVVIHLHGPEEETILA